MPQAQVEGVSVAIESRRPAIAEAAVARHFSKHPELQERYGEQGSAKCKQDADYHLAFLAEAIASGAPALFTAYVQWARSMLAARNVPAADLAENLRVVGEVMLEQLPPESAKVAAEYLGQALSGLDEPAAEPTYLAADDPLTALARGYLEALLSGDRRRAATLITDTVKGGTNVGDIYLRVFQPALYEIGRLWQGNEISVAQEHYCSAATQLIMSQLYPLIFNAARRGKTLIAACVPGDLHEIGLRTVADYFEMAGWDTHYLGANVPTPDLVRLLIERNADVLALSATMTFNLGALRSMIKAVRGREQCKNVLILVGGYPFNIVDELWRSVGADGGARDAAGTLQLAEDLLAVRTAQ